MAAIKEVLQVPFLCQLFTRPCGTTSWITQPGEEKLLMATKHIPDSAMASIFYFSHTRKRQGFIFLIFWSSIAIFFIVVVDATV